MIHDTTTVTDYELSDGAHRVDLRKLLTPNGERLVVESGDASTRLDALALESLTWQDGDFFESLTGEAHDDPVDVPVDAEPTMQISNEYTTIRLRADETHGGSRISLRSPKLEYACWLSTVELDAIAHEPPSFFSELLETPLGPETDHSHVL